jgi:hypothetical protein
MNAVTNEPILGKLEQRLGRLRARQRLGIERDHEAQIFGQGINFVHIENWYSIHSVIRMTLKLTGLYWRGMRNTQRIRVKHNDIEFKTLPSRFNSFTRGQIYGVLGNHDAIRMVPRLEEIGIRMLLNGCEVISRDNQRIYLAGIDDAHYYRVDIMAGFRSSCHTRRKFIARRHTPGSICSCPVTPMEARYVCAAQFRSLWIPFYPGIWGPAAGNIIICWATRLLAVGSSIVAVRLNCLPEITLHHLRRA